MSIRCILTWILGSEGYRGQGFPPWEVSNRTGYGFSAYEMRRSYLFLRAFFVLFPHPWPSQMRLHIQQATCKTLLQFEPRARLPHLHTLFLLLFSRRVASLRASQVRGDPSKKTSPPVENRLVLATPRDDNTHDLFMHARRALMAARARKREREKAPSALSFGFWDAQK